MNRLLFLALLSTAPLAADEEEVPIAYVSTVDGVRYETRFDAKAVKRTGAMFLYDNEKGDNHFWSEPKGIPMAEALANADKEAARILGKDFTGEDPRWVLRTAERRSHGEDAGGGFFYHFSYCTRRGAYSSEDWLGPHGNLQVIVLLDGTVLPTKKSE